MLVHKVPSAANSDITAVSGTTRDTSAFSYKGVAADSTALAVAAATTVIAISCNHATQDALHVLLPVDWPRAVIDVVLLSRRQCSRHGHIKLAELTLASK